MLILFRCAARAAGAMQQAADLGRSHEGVMCKKLHLIILAILALSVGGSNAASDAISTTVTPAPSVQVVVTVPSCTQCQRL